MSMMVNTLWVLILIVVEERIGYSTRFRKEQGYWGVLILIVVEERIGYGGGEGGSYTTPNYVLILIVVEERIGL